MMLQTSPENRLSPYQSRLQTGYRLDPKGSTWWICYGDPGVVVRGYNGQKR